MKVSTTDISREGNDCYIYESISLIEQFGLYCVLNIQKVSGWAEREEACVLITTSDKQKAITVYESYGGKLNETLD